MSREMAAKMIQLKSEVVLKEVVVLVWWWTVM